MSFAEAFRDRLPDPDAFTQRLAADPRLFDGLRIAGMAAVTPGEEITRMGEATSVRARAVIQDGLQAVGGSANPVAKTLRAYFEEHERHVMDYEESMRCGVRTFGQKRRGLHDTATFKRRIGVMVYDANDARLTGNYYRKTL